MSFFRWGPKPSVGEQRRQAEKKLAQLRKGGKVLSPVVIEGRTIASSFWGKSWCTNLERYSDYANRVPRGRSYARHGCVIDLQIARGEIAAQVNGSSLYKIRITVAPLGAKNWAGICDDTSSSIDSMVELLQGRLSKAVMDRVCRIGDGLFPAPKEIELSCSCPDGAYMCKHVAAALYGVGARLDSRPELLFLLRGVDQRELIARAGAAPAVASGKKAAKSGKVLADADLASVFGLDLVEAGEAGEAGDIHAAAPAPPARKKVREGTARKRVPAETGRAKNAKARVPAARGRRTKQRLAAAGKKRPKVSARPKDQVPISIA